MMASAGEMPARSKILVIDDDPDVLEAFELVLSSRKNWDVTPALTGEHAVEVVRRDHFDLVISDLRMPGMSGSDILVALKAIDPELRVVIVSGFVTDAIASECESLGAFGCIRKPFDVADLLSMLTRALA